MNPIEKDNHITYMYLIEDKVNDASNSSTMVEEKNNIFLYKMQILNVMIFALFSLIFVSNSAYRISIFFRILEKRNA